VTRCDICGVEVVLGVDAHESTSGAVTCEAHCDDCEREKA
jgi:hypothetical protein